MSLGNIPLEEMVTACSVFMGGGAKNVSVFYSETDQYGRKKVMEISIVQEVGKVSDETAGKSDQIVRTANPYT